MVISIFSLNAESIDSLYSILSRLDKGVQKVEVYNQLTKQYLPVDVDSVSHYNDKAKHLALDINDQAGLMLAYKYECFVHSLANEQHKAIESAKKSFEIAQELNDSSMMAANFNNIALLHDKLGNLETAIEFMELSNQYYPDKKKGEKQLMYFQNLAFYYAKINHLTKAKSLVEEASLICANEEDNYACQKLDLVKGYIFLLEEKFIQGETSVNKAIQAAKENNDRLLQADGYEIQSEILLKQNRYEEAKKAINKAINILEKEISAPNNYKIYSLHGKIEMALGNYKLAESILTNNLESAQNNPNKKNLSNAHLDLSEVKSRQHKPEEAFYHYRKHRDLEEEITKDIRAKTISAIKFKNEIKVQQSLNDYLLKEQEQDKLIIKQNRKLNGWVTVASLLLMITFVQYYRAFNKQKQVNKELSTLVEERTNEILDLNSKFSLELIYHQENEKTRISKELHDHIGHELLLLKHELGNQSPSSASKVDSILEDVRSISKGLHPVSLNQFGLTKALEGLTERNDKSSDIVFSHQLVNIDQYFSYQNALNIYRMVQEAFTNVIKHSKATAAQLQINFDADKINIVIRDNGIGLQKEYKNGIGIFSIQSRINAMNGNFNFSENKPRGTVLNIGLPLTHS